MHDNTLQISLMKTFEMLRSPLAPIIFLAISILLQRTVFRDYIRSYDLFSFKGFVIAVACVVLHIYLFIKFTSAGPKANSTQAPAPAPLIEIRPSVKWLAYMGAAVCGGIVSLCLSFFYDYGVLFTVHLITVVIICLALALAKGSKQAPEAIERPNVGIAPTAPLGKTSTPPTLDGP
ncbi:MAG: hypothetical protein ACOYOF_08280 [Verrucomicrobiaceae bacterium]